MPAIGTSGALKPPSYSDSYACRCSSSSFRIQAWRDRIRCEVRICGENVTSALQWPTKSMKRRQTTFIIPEKHGMGPAFLARTNERKFSKFSFRHPRTPHTGRHKQMQIQHRSRAPGPPYHSHPPGRAAYRLAPPGRLKRVLKAHLHLGFILPALLHTGFFRARFFLVSVVVRALRPTGQFPLQSPQKSSVYHGRRMWCARHVWGQGVH